MFVAARSHTFAAVAGAINAGFARWDLAHLWQHLCTVGPERVDPEEVYGMTPSRPVPYWGWGDVPDQSGRRFANDDGDGPIPPDPEGWALLGKFLGWYMIRKGHGRPGAVESGRHGHQEAVGLAGEACRSSTSWDRS